MYRDPRDEFRILNYLTYEQRQEFISDIKRVYPAGKKYTAVLHSMTDAQLIAYRNTLIETGKLRLHKSEIYLRVIQRDCNSNTYILEDTKDGYIFYLGYQCPSTTYQVGVLMVSHNWVITSCELMGITLRRFKGMKLRIPKVNEV